MDWVELRISVTNSPGQEHSIWVLADTAQLDASFPGGGGGPSAVVAIGAVHLPLAHALNCTQNTERFASFADPARSKLKLGGPNAVVRWDPAARRLSWSEPFPGQGHEPPILFTLWLQSPFMVAKSPWIVLSFAFVGTLLAQDAVVCAVFSMGQDGQPATVLLRETRLDAILTRPFPLNGDVWSGAPLLLSQGDIYSVIPENERWRRTASFVHTTHVFTHAMSICAENAHAGGAAAVVGFFGVLAFDGRGDGQTPRDLFTFQNAPPLRGASAEAWQVEQTCHVSATARPSNHDARPTRIWNTLSARLLESLHRVKGSDPSSLAFRVDDVEENWRLSYLTLWGTHGSWHAEVTDFVLRSAPLDLAASCPSFIRHEGDGLKRTFRVLDARYDPGTTSLTFSARDVTSPAKTSWVRVGSLDLGFGANAAVPPDGSVVLLFSKGLRAEIAEVKATLELRLSEFRPTGQDPAVGESSADGQVIVPLDERGIVGDLVLTCEERVAVDESHTLSFRLTRQHETTKADFRLLVIDTEPFFVGLVRARFGEAPEIGHRSSLSSWDLSDARTAEEAVAELVLPPQAIGEEELKRYDEAGFVPPVGEPLAYRYSPATVLGIRRSVYVQGYTEAPWNVRRLFGNPDQEFPGVPLTGASTELHYGLAVDVAPPPLTRICDALHRAGPILAFQAAGMRPLTARARDVVRTRVTQLEPYLVGQAEGWSTTAASARFRPSRQVADPITPLAPVFPYLPIREGHEGASWGVRGGVDWGFESRNILAESRQGASTSAALFDLKLSALGGSGLIKAGFAQDKTTIFANAFLGRTFFKSIVRIGRIGVLWNVAKHIIVYERSLKASEQFPDATGDWEGRAALRKVREVVHVSEDARGFPDRDSAAQAVTFVVGSRFQKEPIEVDSRWGRDVPDGWEIPLYRPGAAHTAPAAFLDLVAATGETLSAQIQNTEDLYFFSSTRKQDGADPNTWAPISEVDFPLRDIPVREDDPNLAVADQPLPDAPATEPGLRRFTFRVDTAGHRVNLGHRRTEAVLGARLDNVVLARRAVRNVRADDATLHPDITGALARIRRGPERRAPRDRGARGAPRFTNARRPRCLRRKAREGDSDPVFRCRRRPERASETAILRPLLARQTPRPPRLARPRKSSSARGRQGGSRSVAIPARSGSHAPPAGRERRAGPL